MLLVLFTLLPFLGSGVALIVKEHRLLGTGIALGTLILEANLLHLLGNGDSFTVGEIVLGLGPLGVIFLLLFLTVASFAMAYSHWVQRWPDFPPRVLLVLGCVNATVLTQNLYLTVFLLQVTSLTTLTLTHSPTFGTDSLRSFQRYLVLMALSGLFLTLAFALMENFLLYRDNLLLAKFIFAMMAIGFGIRLAVIPLHLWLPDLSEHAPPMGIAVIVGIVNSTALLLLMLTFQNWPWLLAAAHGQRLLLLGAVAAIVGGAILALGEGDLNRMFAYGGVHSFGFVLLGLASTSADGTAEAVFAAISLALSLLLVFMSLGMIGYCTGESRIDRLGGLRASLPVASTGLIVGLLSLLGIPPSAAFASRWMLLFESAAREGTWLLVTVSLGSLVAAMALFSAFLRTFFGTDPGGKVAKEPLPAAVLVLLLCAILLFLGLVPGPVLRAVQNATAGFAY